MIKALASLITLLSVLMVLGYMAGEAQAAESGARERGPSKSHAKTTKGRKAVAHVRGKHKSHLSKAAYRTTEPAHPSMGQQLGLHQGIDPLALRSSVALVIDQTTGQSLLDKNSSAVLPIASITKLMTALVVVESNQPMDAAIDIDEGDRDTMKNTHSRLRFGSSMTRSDALHLALMASENRAASSLGRHYPGGIEAFVAAMNAKAASLGMADTHYVDSSGLSPDNRSSARDLAKLVKAAYAHPMIREYSTSPSYAVTLGNREIAFSNTNRLVKNPDWTIGLQKTGYISEAGQCLVMQAEIAGRKLVLVLLDAQGRLSRIGDASRIRAWLERTVIDKPATTTVTASDAVVAPAKPLSNLPAFDATPSVKPAIQLISAPQS